MRNLKLQIAALAVAVSLFFSSAANAEIHSITVSWTRGLCTPICMKNLDSQFRRLYGVADVQMNQAGASAILTWKPTVPFSWQALEAPLSMIGLSVEHLRTKVTGKISHDDRTVWLSSTGDGTRFVVLGTMQPSATQFTETYNTESYVLTPQQRAVFIDAESQNLPVTIEGTIFMPERSPPLVLIAEKTQVGKPESAKTEQGASRNL